MTPIEGFFAMGGGAGAKARRALDAGAWQDAADSYRKALEQRRADPMLWLGYGKALAGLGQKAEAEAATLRALALDSDLPPAHAALAELGWSDSQIAKARAMCGGGSKSPAAGSRPDGTDPKDYDAIAPYFDRDWYRERYTDVPASADVVAHYLNRGVYRGYNPIALFDSHWYLASQPDVWKAGENPFSHFVRWGAAEGRLGHPVFDAKLYRERAGIGDASMLDILQHFIATGRRAGLTATVTESLEGECNRLQGELAASQARAETLARCAGIIEALPPSPRQFRVLYVSGASNIPSHQYRVTNYIAALRHAGIDGDWIDAGQCDHHLEKLQTASIVIFWRVGHTEAVARFLAAARALHLPTVFDVDDYVFEPEIANLKFIDGIRFVPSHELEAYHHGVRVYRTMLLSCQFATFTTQFLVERGCELGRQSFLLPNGLDEAYLKAQPRPPHSNGGRVIIGYTPGTRTHQKDIRVAAGAIARVLKEYPNAVLRIVGDFDIDEIAEWRDCRRQIEHDFTIGRDHVRAATLQFDINIAPVELENPFTEAKSELKYFEPACLGVPSIVSATRVFQDAVRAGETGFVATTQDDWYRALAALVADAGLRQRIGQAARTHALEAYGQEGIGAKARQVYAEIIAAWRKGQGRTAKSLTITMVLITPFKGSGGHAKAIAMARGLADLGHDVVFHIMGGLGEFQNHAEIRAAFGIPDYIAMVSGHEQIRPCDVAIATYWKTAHAIAEQKNCARVKAYFMQDYEPMFYPMSDDYMGAQQSYLLGLRNISYGPWIRDRIRHELEAPADSVPFFIDKSVFHAAPNYQRESDRLIVFARPEMARRLWNTTAAALTLLAERGFKGRIEFFGSYAEPNVSFPHINHRVISPPEMAKLFQAGTVGLALSSTNPSMIPFEMMACGMPVIDINYNNNHVNYGGNDTVYLAAPTPEGLCDAIERLFVDPELRDARSRKGLEFMETMPGRFEVFRQLESLLADYVAQADGAAS